MGKLRFQRLALPQSNRHPMNLNNFSIRTRITAGLVIILLLALLSTANSLYRNISIKFESGEVAASWIPAIENLGHMKGLLAEHHFSVTDRVDGRDSTDVSAFVQKLKANDDALNKATEVYAATLLSYLPGDPNADKEKALYADYQTTISYTHLTLPTKRIV